MQNEDQDYYYRRAEEEIALAQQANHERSVRAHYLLAGYYLDRVYGTDPVFFREALPNKPGGK